jgi:hypothetical protein
MKFYCACCIRTKSDIPQYEALIGLKSMKEQTETYLTMLFN